MVTRTACFAIALAIMALPAQAMSGGVIEVSDGSDGPRFHAWWLRSKQIRPEGTTLGRHSLETLNSAKPASDVQSYCSVEPVTREMFRSSDTATQQEIQETFDAGYGTFDLRWQPKGAPELHAQIGIFSTCEDQDKTGFITIVTREDSGEILLLEEYVQGLGVGRVLNLYRDDEEVRLSGCFECDDEIVLRYDATNGKLYWESDEE